MIATCISTGVSIDGIRAPKVVGSRGQMFDKVLHFKRLRLSYNDEPRGGKLRVEMNRALGRAPDAKPVTPGDPGLSTVLMMVMSKHTIDAPRPLWYHPAAMYKRV